MPEPDDDDAMVKAIGDREEFCALIADGVSELNAALTVGWTPYRLRREMQDDQFAEVVDVARSQADGTIEEALFRLARNGNMSAIQMWLYNRRPDVWKDTKRIEVRSELTVNLGVVASAKQAVLELLREQGPAALQPAAIEPHHPIVDAEVVEGARPESG